MKNDFTRFFIWFTKKWISLRIQLKSFFLFVFLFLLFFFLGFYIYYLYKYPKHPGINHLTNIYPKDIILKTGGVLRLPESRLQHFLNFPPSKESSVIRIGAFGDSYTFGSEVDKKSSYPYYLQQLFNNNFPHKKVEVLNFGIDGTGFQEQFFLWKKYAKSYDLDYILLGPRGFHSERDLTFSKNWYQYFKYPRARFILLNKDHLKLLQIQGDSLQERYKNYYTLIPPWIALRYDKKPFQIYEKFSPWLRHNIPNPFYYKKMSFEEESAKINILLLKKIKHLYNRKILFFTDFKSFFDHYKAVKNLYNINLIPGAHNHFYKVFVHKSSLGNEFIAKIYYNALIGKKQIFFNIINCYLKVRPKTKFLNKRFKNLQFHEVQSIQIIAGNASPPVFTLKPNSFLNHYENSNFNHKKDRIKSFIGFSNGSEFLEAPYMPLPIQLNKGMKVYMQFNNKSKIKLGSIKPLDTYEKFFMFYEKYIKSVLYLDLYQNYKYFFLLKQMPFISNELAKNDKIELFIENYKLGDLKLHNNFGEPTLKLTFNRGYEKSFIMTGPSHHIKEKDLPFQFSLYMQYNLNNGEVFKSLIPDWKCKKDKQNIQLNLPHFNPLY